MKGIDAIMKNKTDVAIIGAGVTGLSIAYELYRKGMRDITLFDMRFPGYGATGRCGAGVRAQWGLEMNCRLTKHSIQRFTTLSDELGTDIEFRQGGYLVLVEKEEQLKQISKNVKLQNSLGIPSRIIDKQEALQIVPQLNLDYFVDAVFCPTDGHANPLLTVWAYYNFLKNNGVKFYNNTKVTDILTDKGKITSVKTNKGEIFHTNTVVNCAGGWSQNVAEMVGIKLPLRSERHQIFVTEPVGHLFDPMVISFKTGLYIQQVPHGSVLTGIGESDAPEMDMSASWQFLRTMAVQIQNVLPSLTELNIVRQWSGMYNKSPDAQPILGPISELQGFYLSCGFSGHGFMVAPVVGEIISAMITDYTPPFDATPLSLKRFDTGELIREPSVIG